MDSAASRPGTPTLVEFHAAAFFRANTPRGPRRSSRLDAQVKKTRLRKDLVANPNMLLHLSCFKLQQIQFNTHRGHGEGLLRQRQVMAVVSEVLAEINRLQSPAVAAPTNAQLTRAVSTTAQPSTSQAGTSAEDGVFSDRMDVDGGRHCCAVGFETGPPVDGSRSRTESLDSAVELEFDSLEESESRDAEQGHLAGPRLCVSSSNSSCASLPGAGTSRKRKRARSSVEGEEDLMLERPSKARCLSSAPDGHVHEALQLRSSGVKGAMCTHSAQTEVAGQVPCVRPCAVAASPSVAHFPSRSRTGTAQLWTSLGTAAAAEA